MAYRTERIGFRFLVLTDQALVELRGFQEGVMSRPSRSVPGFVTGGFDLVDGRNYDWMIPFIEKHSLDESNYGLFVSLATDNDSDVMTVPEFALRLSRKVGGEVSFSFTVLSED